MDESNALINIGELSKPATVLIEKISEAIGGIFRPYQIRRTAEAEIHVEKIRAVSQIEISELQQRALHRFMIEEGKKQDNIENITKKALKDVRADAQPTKIEDDWITNFFDRCRLVSDDEMQQLWSKILAGQANTPGRYSKRMINLLSSLDKSDAQLFTNLCSFGWSIGNFVPLIYDEQAEIYSRLGITFESLKHLDEIGLLSYAEGLGYNFLKLPQVVIMHYYNDPIRLEFENPEDNELRVGKVLLSKVGQELTSICDSKPVPGFREYVIQIWKELGIKVDESNTRQTT